MERREFFGSLISSGAAITEDVAQDKKDWTNRFSPHDLWACVERGVAAHPEARREIRREVNRALQAQRRQTRRAARLAAGVNDSVLWRGVITDDLPWHSEPRVVQDRRKREVLVATAKGGPWQGIEITAGSRILVDSRVPDESLIGQRGEIIECADGRVRIHIWPANRRRGVVETSSACPACGGHARDCPDFNPSLDYTGMTDQAQSAGSAPILPPLMWDGISDWR